MTRNKDSDVHNQYNRFENKITRLFDDFLNDVGFTRTHAGGSKSRGGNASSDCKPTWSPAIDIVENDGDYLVIADVPGIKKEDIDVEFHDSVLVISGHHSQDTSTTVQAQEINVDNQSRQQQSTDPQYQYQQKSQPQQSTQYQQQPQPQQSTQYQQQPQPQQSTQYQQQPQPQQYQQSTDPKYQQQQQPQPQQSTDQKYQQSQSQQQPTEAQKYQQSVDQKHHLSNEPQSTGQQSNETQQYQHLKQRHHQEASQNEKFHVQERPYGYFSRSIQLPSNIKADDEFYASLENGVLKIRVPKNSEKPRKKITIS